MTAERFTLDTNILVYSIDAQAGVRRMISERIVGLARRLDCRLTLQSVCEFYAASTRKGRMSSADAAAQANDWLQMFACVPHSPSAVRTALSLASAGSVSFWDALLISAAAEGGCTAILTEDMADGAVIGGVRVINPFAATDLAPAAATLLA